MSCSLTWEYILFAILINNYHVSQYLWSSELIPRRRKAEDVDSVGEHAEEALSFIRCEKKRCKVSSDAKSC